MAEPQPSPPHLPADQLLPLVYDELRRLAAQKLAQEKPGQTLNPTALVHEAYLRLNGDQHFDHRGHFFAAAAEAMRRILVDKARRRHALKREGAQGQVDVHEADPPGPEPSPELLAVHEALDELASHDTPAAELVKLRYFLGMTHQEAAATLDLGRRAADRLWAVARAWLYQRLQENPEKT